MLSVCATSKSSNVQVQISPGQWVGVSRPSRSWYYYSHCESGLPPEFCLVGGGWMCGGGGGGGGGGEGGDACVLVSEV